MQPELVQQEEHVRRQKNKMTEKNLRPKEKTMKNTQIPVVSKKEVPMEVQTEKKQEPQNKGEEKPTEAKTEEKTEIKKPIQKKAKVPKLEASVNGVSLHISTKTAKEICRFIKGKKISSCITYLEQVERGRKVMPMRGEIPHRKGDFMSGRYPKNASREFIIMLKSLNSNAIFNEIEDPLISMAMANKASRPYGRFGKYARKRTHVLIKCTSAKKTDKK